MCSSYVTVMWFSYVVVTAGVAAGVTSSTPQQQCYVWPPRMCHEQYLRACTQSHRCSAHGSRRWVRICRFETAG